MVTINFEHNGDGNRTVATAGTRVQLSSTPLQVERVDVSAKETNTGTIVVGGDTVVASLSTRRGIPLNAGDVYCIDMPADLNRIYIDATVSGDSVTFAWWRGNIT